VTEHERPLVTFAVLAYNQEAFVRKAVEGALAQTYSPLEIVLSDDCSSDRTFEVMREATADYAGPHTVLLRRNHTNRGIGGHINALMRLTRGDLIVVSAGDDISMPRRVERMVTTWLSEGGRADLLCSGYVSMSNTGVALGTRSACDMSLLTPERMARSGHGVLGATMAWTSRLWRTFGDLAPDVVNEDQVLSFRAILCGGIRSINEPLVQYRQCVSTWIGRGAAGHGEIQRRNGVLARNAHRNALMARDDVIKVGREDLIALTQIRVMEAKVLDRLHNEDLPRFREMSHAVLSGAKLGPIVGAYLRRRLPLLHALVHAGRRVRAGRG
jgi:glycosyltransferase involved in cell wall biosynthesis